MTKHTIALILDLFDGGAGAGADGAGAGEAKSAENACGTPGTSGIN